MTLKVSAVLAPTTVSVPERPKITWQSCKYDEAAEAAEQARIRRDEPEKGRTVASQKQASQEAERAEREKQKARICEERAIAQADIEAQWANAAAAQNSAAIAGAFFKWSAVEVLAVLLAVGAAFWAAIEARRSANVAEAAAKAEASRHSEDIRRADAAAAEEKVRRDAEADQLRQQSADARRFAHEQLGAELIPVRCALWFTQDFRGTIYAHFGLTLFNGGKGIARNVTMRIEANIRFPRRDDEPWLKEARWQRTFSGTGDSIPEKVSIEAKLGGGPVRLPDFDHQRRHMEKPNPASPRDGDPTIGSVIDDLKLTIYVAWDSVVDPQRQERRGPYICHLFDLEGFDYAEGLIIEDGKRITFTPRRAMVIGGDEQKP